MKRFYPGIFFILVLPLCLFSSLYHSQGEIIFSNRSQPDVPSPKSILGYDIGEEGHLTYYEDILKYFNAVAHSSDRVKVIKYGVSTEGRPMVYAIVTSEKNHSKLDYYKSIIKKLADPRKIDAKESRRLTSEGKPVVLIETNIHSKEVSSAESIMAFLYKLASAADPETINILDNTIALLIASQNPDGHDDQCDWYYKYKNSKYKGLSHTASPPNYHKYLGHDTNRDFISFQIIESRNLANLVNEWQPTLHHCMHQISISSIGWREAFLPHATWPYGGQAHPTVISEWMLLGGEVFNEMARQGLPGYYCTGFEGVFYHPSGSANYSLGHGSNLSMNETAGVWGGSSVTIKPDAIRKKDQKQFWYNYIPWEGVKWSLKDCVSYEMILLKRILSCVSKYHEQFLGNFALRLRDQYEKGLNSPPYAFILPPLSKQRDPVVTSELINKLILGMTEIHVSKSSFKADGIKYPAGSYVILMSQPMRLWAKYLLEVQKQPPMERPSDVTAWTQGYMTGSEVIQVDNAFSVELKLIEKALPPKGLVKSRSEYAYIFSNSMNNASIAINRLLQDNQNVYLASESFTDSAEWLAGTVIVRSAGDVHKNMKKIANDLHLAVHGLDKKLDVKTVKLKQQKIGLYLPVTGGKGNMEEGHTRLILEKHEFPFHQVDDAEVIKGNLKEKFNILIMADGSAKAFYEGPYQPHPLATRGLGKKGARNLREFVLEGGIFIGIGNGGGLFPIKYFSENFGLNIAESEGFFCPGSILKMNVDNKHPIGFGMPEEVPAFFWNGPIYESTTTQPVATYAEKDTLMSGWIEGEDKIINKAAIIDMPFGKGRVILIGFSVLQRGQTSGTFKFLFNAIHYGGAVSK
jgi:hypothetical protein